MSMMLPRSSAARTASFIEILWGLSGWALGCASRCCCNYIVARQAARPRRSKRESAGAPAASATCNTPRVRTVTATRYVTKLREGGSLPGLVEADDDGLYVVKFRGAGQGPKALVAELVAGELARHLGLTVPEIVFVEIAPVLGRAEPDVEVWELLDRSPGVTLGLDFLPGALPFVPAAGPIPAPEIAAEIVWFD